MRSRLPERMLPGNGCAGGGGGPEGKEFRIDTLFEGKMEVEEKGRHLPGKKSDLVAF